MAPIRYSLHYEDYSEHLMSRYAKLLQMQSLVDMTLMCSSHTLRVHKVVLAASSAYFQEILQKQTGEPLIILKMKFNVLKCLVEFMYCGKTQCLEENLDELVSAAQFLKIKGLSKVTKEGLGINSHSDLPVFTPPVVVSRSPQSLIDCHSQDYSESKTPPQMTNNNQPLDNRANKDTVVRIPFDIASGTSAVDVSDPTRGIRPRRGRPSFKRSNTWESGNSLGRAAERALMRREQDSRKAICHLKHLQTKHMKDYVDTVTLSEAVNSICNNDGANSYLNMENDLLFMDQSISSNALDTIPYSKDSLGNDAMTSTYSTANMNTSNETVNNEINTAMSEYVNALKNAGLPTDLPILFESGDGSYINVNEQVLLDMVQSNEIQYEVIEQPNIIEKVADPSEIKSIDDLSRSIERGEMLGAKSYTADNNFHKNCNNIHEETINSLNEILPDNLEPFDAQQNYVVLNQPNSTGDIEQDVAHDFASIDSDMQFLTKSMSDDDVKKFYEEQQLNETRALDQFCPNSSLDTSFNMSLLDTKPHYNTDDLKRNNSYDFTLQLAGANDLKEDPLNYLMSTPKHTRNEDSYMEHSLDNRLQEQDEIMKDLMNIESKIMQSCDSDAINDSSLTQPTDVVKFNDDIQSNEKNSNCDKSFNTHLNNDFQWEFESIQAEKNINSPKDTFLNTPKAKSFKRLENITAPIGLDVEMGELHNEDFRNKENESPNSSDLVRSTLDENIPFAVGLLPLKQVDASDSLLKNKNANNIDTSHEGDNKYLKRKNKLKKTND